MGKLYFTCSFDDGDVADLRLADLLSKYKLKGTFYVPQTCDLVSQSLNETQIRELSGIFEIGGHTMSHKVLTRINDTAARREIENCKEWLQNVTGKVVETFCPPTGRFNQYHVAVQMATGFTSTRTVEMLSYSSKKVRVVNGFVFLPTTSQVYNHTSTAYLKNNIKRLTFSRLYLLRKLFNPDWQLMSNKYIDHLREISQTGADECFFHLWGHSWELERYSLWDSLDTFLKNICSLGDIVPCTNSELAEVIRAERYE